MILSQAQLILLLVCVFLWTDLSSSYICLPGWVDKCKALFVLDEHIHQVREMSKCSLNFESQESGRIAEF